MSSTGAQQLWRLWLPVVAIAAFCVTSAVLVRAQHDHPQPALPDNFKEPMPLYPAPTVLGAFTRAISS